MATVSNGGDQQTEAIEERSPKRLRVESPRPDNRINAEPRARVKGEARIKAEYLIPIGKKDTANTVMDDDAAEAAGKNDANIQREGKRSKQRGQNKGRSFGHTTDLRGLCSTRVLQPEFSPLDCSFGDKCKYEHDLRRYLREHKRENLTSFNGQCPAWEATGICRQGWKCRFLASHMEEREHEDGRRELLLIQKGTLTIDHQAREDADAVEVVNGLATDIKAGLTRRGIEMPKSEVYLKWLEQTDKTNTKDDDSHHKEESEQDKRDHRAGFIDPALLPSEKRRIYFGPETPALAPLTTQGNLPFRRLCVELGAQATYSEMAMGMSLLQGHKAEWALMKAHRSEVEPPTASPGANITALGYENSKDLRFGAQIAGNKPYNVVKATEILTRFCPQLRVVDLNCGCPIDQVYSKGAGSALLDSAAKLEKMLLGMNAVSGEVPITVKIRMGTRDAKPTAEKLVDRLINGSPSVPTTPGVAAITLHGRSRQQRYTRSADWQYIASCAALVNRYRTNDDAIVDTVREADERYRPAGNRIYFLGNGDCYSHEDYIDHINHAGVDTVMVARGALIKPWIFEEIAAGQHLDKSASERLDLIQKYVRYGLEAWGSDELGIGHVRRFLLEWLSFAHRYVPVGILEHLPPNIQDRPPAWRGRNELETLLASSNYKDWIKISEMFLGPAGDGFKFTPKHRSNSYEIQAEG